METHIGVNDKGEILQVNDNGSTGRVIDKVYAALAVDENGHESIISMRSPIGEIPMVFSNPQLIEKVKPQIKEMAALSGKKIKIVAFSTREVLEEIG